MPMQDAEQFDLSAPRSIGAILAATARMYRAFPLLFAVLALAVMAPFELAVLAVAGHGPLSQHESFRISWLLFLMRTSLITPLIAALHMQAVVEIGQGRRPRLASLWAAGLRALPVVAAAAIASDIGIALGFLALIIPGVLLSLRWAVVAQAAAVEPGGWLDALRSSQRLTATHYGHVLGLILLTAVFTNVSLIGARAIPLGDRTGAASVALGIGLDTVIASFVALTLALLYFDLKARPRQAPQGGREHQHLRDLD